MGIRRARVNIAALIPVFLLGPGCVLPVTDTVIDPGYWPDRFDPNGILVSRLYMEVAVDDAGRSWLIPGTGSNLIYRADSSCNDISIFELDSAGIDIAAGAGYVWVIPSRIDPDAKVVLLTPSKAGSDEVYRIDPETGEVNGRISLPVPFGVIDISAGHDFVWVYGRKQVGMFNFSYPFIATKIDASSLQVLGTYELPNPVPLNDGREISQLIEPQLLLINEAGYLLLAYWPKEVSQRGQRIVVKFELDTGEYSEYTLSLTAADLQPHDEKVILTRRGIRDLGVEPAGIGCM